MNVLTPSQSKSKEVTIQYSDEKASLLVCVRFEVFMAVTMKNGIFWDVAPYGSCKNQVLEELSASIIRVTRIGELGTMLAVTSN
jgi:hypothetical protein